MLRFEPRSRTTESINIFFRNRFKASTLIGKSKSSSKTAATVLTEFDHVRSADFISDALWGGRSFPGFHVIDDFNREVLAVEIDTGISAHRVVRFLDRIANRRGLPARIGFDNGPEMQNGFIERLNRSYREAVLNMYIFKTLDEVRTETEKWLSVYNRQRPHESLGNLSPMEYLEKFNSKTVI